MVWWFLAAAILACWRSSFFALTAVGAHNAQLQFLAPVHQRVVVPEES
jgi:hypothetical protein